jgi:FkbM family methyltransferase
MIKTYVDCGAFIGDDFLTHLAQFPNLTDATLFEPDPGSFATLADRGQFAGKVKLHAVNAAIAKEAGQVHFAAGGHWGSKIVTAGEANTVAVTAIPLDAACAGLNTPLYIKMDIEGYELAALEGAAKLLAGDQAVFSVTLEHKAHDLFEIPEFLGRFAHRRHYLYAHDSEFAMDLVLYSVPEALLAPSFRG